MAGKVARDEAILKIAERQQGVVGIRQLRDLGLSEDAIRRRVHARRLHRIHRGVYAVGRAALAPEGLWFAAVLAVGRGPLDGSGSVLAHWRAALSHRSAARLWNLLPVRDDSTDVVVRGDGGRARRSGIRVHRSLTLVPDEVTLRRGIPVTTPNRTVADLRRATAEGWPGGLRPDELRRAVRQANVLGLPIDEESAADRTRSDLERDFLRLCRRHGLPLPEVNVRVGRYLVDFLWRENRLVVETDGYLYHRGQAAFQDDRARDLRLKLLGHEVLRLSEQQVNEEPDAVARTLATAIRGGPLPGPRA